MEDSLFNFKEPSGPELVREELSQELGDVKTPLSHSCCSEGPGKVTSQQCSGGNYSRAALDPPSLTLLSQIYSAMKKNQELGMMKREEAVWTDPEEFCSLFLR